MKVSKLLTIAVLALGVSGVAASDAFADAGDITYRQKVMQAVGGHMGAMATILKGQGGDMKNFAAHADGMVALAMISQTAFPKDSSQMEGKTEALDAIWDKPADFAKVNMAFLENAKALAAAAKTGDKGAIGAALGGLGKNGCKACHTDFRAKKK